ncbi:hypothetical protein DFH28DRAFT_978512, partial [Melampsora americana]
MPFHAFPSKTVGKFFYAFCLSFCESARNMNVFFFFHFAFSYSTLVCNLIDSRVLSTMSLIYFPITYGHLFNLYICCSSVCSFVSFLCLKSTIRDQCAAILQKLLKFEPISVTECIY